MTATITELQSKLLEVLPELPRTDLTTESHAAAGAQVWVERDQIGWHAYMTTPQIEAQYISSRFYEANLDDLKAMAIECADQAVADLTPAPVAPAAKPKTKKTRKAKAKKPICTCPSCTNTTVASGSFYCLNLSEWGVYSAGQLLGYRNTQGDAETLFRNHRYTQLTKHAA